MTIVRYYRDQRPWTSVSLMNPVWEAVQNAIHQMDNYCFPIVQLNCTDLEDDENIFNIIGGKGRFALFQFCGPWQYEDPNGGSDEVRLWESDQGYFCLERNVLTDINKVLRITKVFYDNGSYENLDRIE